MDSRRLQRLDELPDDFQPQAATSSPVLGEPLKLSLLIPHDKFSNYILNTAEKKKDVSKNNNQNTVTNANNPSDGHDDHNNDNGLMDQSILNDDVVGGDDNSNLRGDRGGGGSSGGGGNGDVGGGQAAEKDARAIQPDDRNVFLAEERAVSLEQWRANKETAYRLKTIADSVNVRYTRMQKSPFLQVIPLLKGFARTSRTSLERCLHRASTCCRDFWSTFGFPTFDSLFKSLSNCFSVTYNHARRRASNFIVSVESHERIRATLIRFTAAFILFGAIYLNISG